MIRRLALIPILLVIWLALLAWSAGVPWGSHWSARERLTLSGRDFHVQLGDGVNGLEGLVVNALGNDGTGLQTARLTHVRADQYPVLRYRITNFSDMLELALVFRRKDAPDDVKTISLPAPDGGEVTVDLSGFEEWRDEITELGFAEYATAQLVPPSMVTSLHPFRIESVELQAPTWDTILPHLRTDWFGYRPWSLQSINTIGPGRGTLGRSWMTPILSIGVLLTWLVACILLRLSRTAAVKVACGIVAAAWIVVDLRWLGDFSVKHQVTEAVYGGKSWPQRLALQPDEDTQAVTGDVARIAGQQGVKRVLIHADSPFTLLRLIYFLLPLNTAPLEQTMSEAAGAALPSDALIAVYGSDWKYDETTGLLGNGKQAVPARAIYTKGDLHVFRSERLDP